MALYESQSHDDVELAKVAAIEALRVQEARRRSSIWKAPTEDEGVMEDKSEDQEDEELPACIPREFPMPTPTGRHLPLGTMMPHAMGVIPRRPWL